jgi:antitoxin component YwqK of YwqJK toxin-antitoxin module
MEWLKYFVIKHEECNLYVNALQQGIVIIKGANGIVYGVQNYLDGEFDGYQCGWCSNDDTLPTLKGRGFTLDFRNLCYEYYYIRGKKHGIHRGWHSSGRLWFEFIYDNGVLISSQEWTAG